MKNIINEASQVPFNVEVIRADTSVFSKINQVDNMNKNKDKNKIQR